MTNLGDSGSLKNLPAMQANSYLILIFNYIYCTGAKYE